MAETHHRARTQATVVAFGDAPPPATAADPPDETPAAAACAAAAAPVSGEAPAGNGATVGTEASEQAHEAGNGATTPVVPPVPPAPVAPVAPLADASGCASCLDDLGRSAACRLKLVPLDDDLCLGARYAGAIARGDGGERAAYCALRVGDVLLCVDERPCVSLGYAEILAALRRPAPLTLRFSRVKSSDAIHGADSPHASPTARATRPSFVSRLTRMVSQ